MRRELAVLLGELRDGVAAHASRAGMRLTAVEMTLPIDLLVVLHGGGPLLLADVPRSRADDTWLERQSRLHVSWRLVPAAEVLQ
jgi:hypothetical protein